LNIKPSLCFKALKDNPREITEASREAEQITTLVLSYEKEQVKSTNTDPKNINLSCNRLYCLDRERS
jgi:hypothetical protein